MENNIIKRVVPLGFQWQISNPFLFCVHHKDAYPAGNGEMGPAASLAGRRIGQDFELKDGWRMYHGHRVPGFPEHPHRGFETVTVVLDGYVDHFDSMGAAGRYGCGDVQWMTAGSGMQHAEMFPLIHQDRSNPLELFQIWLNLPQHLKMVPPHYRMLWAESIPTVQASGGSSGSVSVRLIAGKFNGVQAPDPAPDSWAADPDNQVAIWLIRMDPNAEVLLPAAKAGVNRTLYCYEGATISIAGSPIPAYHAVEVSAAVDIRMQNGSEPARILMLQGKPINEPVVQQGPFVMNTTAEIQQAFTDYRRTRFGGWPWDRSDPVFPASQGRIARYADGSEDLKGTAGGVRD